MQRVAESIFALLVLCLGGCSSLHRVGIDRLSGTGLTDGDSVAVVVTQSESKGAPVWEAGWCLRSAMMGRNPKIKLVSNNDFKKVVFQHELNKDSSSIARPDDISKEFSEAEVSSRAKAFGIRYLVVSQYNTHVGSGITSGEMSKDGWAIKSTSVKQSTYSADVFDVSGILLGRLNVTIYGETNAGVGFALFVIPFPFYTATPTESYACSIFGRALTDFLLEEKGTICSQYGYAYGSCTYIIK